MYDYVDPLMFRRTSAIYRNLPTSQTLVPTRQAVGACRDERAETCPPRVSVGEKKGEQSWVCQAKK